MKFLLVFFGLGFTIIYNIGCTSQSNVPNIVDSIQVASIYKADDSLTGIFKYTGYANDTTQDKAGPGDKIDGYFYQGGPAYTYRYSSHLVSGTIRIKKIVADDSTLFISRPRFDTVARNTGVLFEIDPSCQCYLGWLQPSMYDSIIGATLINKTMNIPFQSAKITAIDGMVLISGGDGKFNNGQWDLNYFANGTGRGFHGYHLICKK